jgi:hypothetical protein
MEDFTDDFGAIDLGGVELKGLGVRMIGPIFPTTACAYLKTGAV